MQLRPPRSTRHRARLRSALPACLLAAAIGGVALAMLPGGHGQLRAETAGPVTDEIGVVRIGPHQPITIGGLLVLSGPNLLLGLDASRGVQVAFDDHDDMLLGHRIDYRTEDGMCSQEGGRQAALRLAANPQVVAVIGPSCSSEALGGAAILWTAGMVQASPSTTAPSLTAPDRPSGLQGLVRFIFNDTHTADTAVQFVQQRKLHRIATLQDESPYSQQIVAAFVRQLGGVSQLVAQASVTSDAKNMAAALDHIAAAQPDMIFAPLFTIAAADLALRRRTIPALAAIQVLGTDSVVPSTFLEATGPAGLGFTIVGVDRDRRFAGRAYQQLVAKYSARFGEPPVSDFHAYGYDAATSLLAAITQVARSDPDGTVYIGRRALRDALIGSRDQNGMSGPINCNANGDCAGGHFAIFQIIDSTTPGTDGSGLKRIDP